MSVTINTNTAATDAAVNLQKSNSRLQKSLNRLSSGNRITSPADDAGGLAVSMKLSASLRRTEAVNVNLANAVSFLQTQDGAMDTANQILSRVSELLVLYTDTTKNSDDKDNYQAEFEQLQKQLLSLNDEKFNGVPMFVNPKDTKQVVSTEDGLQIIDITVSDLKGTTDPITGATVTLATLAISDVTTAIQSLAKQRAQNGAESNRLAFSSQMLTVNKTNLEAANSRIIDTDVAYESTQVARFNILMQSGASMLAQANAAPQIALKLLQ
jgi:flagellin